MQMPTCDSPFSAVSRKKTRSPGFHLPFLTLLPCFHCAVTFRPMSILATLLKTYQVSPEQSNPCLGDDPPDT